MKSCLNCMFITPTGVLEPFECTIKNKKLESYDACEHYRWYAVEENSEED